MAALALLKEADNNKAADMCREPGELEWNYMSGMKYMLETQIVLVKG